MAVLKSIEIRNFKCFRSPTPFRLDQATYVVGPNNSGKTALLEALRRFFDTNAFHSGLINKTELTGRKAGYNRADLRVTFDLSVVTGKTRQRRMIADFGKSLSVTKSLTWREATDTIEVEYDVAKKKYRPEELPKDLQDLMGAISISYIHPQGTPWIPISGASSGLPPCG